MALPSRNFLPGSSTGMQTQTTPGTSTSTQANVPQDWASIYRSLGIQGEFGGGAGTGAQVGAIGSKTSGPYGDYASGANMSLPGQNAKSDSYTMSTGGAATAGAGASRSSGGMSGGISSATGAGAGSSGSSSGGGGGSLAGLASSFGTAPNPGPEVGMPAGGADPLDVTPPSAAGPQIGAASQGSGNTTQMAAPGGLRPGMGSRIYPALNALLKSPAY